MLIANTTTAAFVVRPGADEATIERAARADRDGKIVIILADPERQEELVRQVMEAAAKLPTLPANTTAVITTEPQAIDADWSIVQKGRRFDLCFKGQTLAEAPNAEALRTFQPNARPVCVKGKWRLPQTVAARAAAATAGVNILSR